MATTRQSYDPYHLINDVQELLRSHGLEPHVAPGNAGEALGGAGMLLRSLGVEPLMDPVDAYKHSLNKVWSDCDHGRG